MHRDCCVAFEFDVHELFCVFKIATEIDYNLAQRSVFFIPWAPFKHFDERPILHTRLQQNSGGTLRHMIVESYVGANVRGAKPNIAPAHPGPKERMPLPMQQAPIHVAGGEGIQRIERQPVKSHAKATTKMPPRALHRSRRHKVAVSETRAALNPTSRQNQACAVEFQRGGWEGIHHQNQRPFSSSFLVGIDQHQE
jgi:hypothetical protein